VGLEYHYFSDMKKEKAWFETDLGFSATKKELRKSKEIAADFQDYKGRLTFHFMDSKDYTVQITSKGKLGIFFPEKSDLFVLLEKVKPHLLTAEGLPAKITGVIDLKETPSTEGEAPVQTKAQSFSRTFFQDVFKKLDKISEVANGRDPDKAFQDLMFLIAKLPTELKERIKPLQDQAAEAVKAKGKGRWEPQYGLFALMTRDEPDPEFMSECYSQTLWLVGEVSSILHAHTKEPKGYIIL